MLRWSINVMLRRFFYSTARDKLDEKMKKCSCVYWKLISLIAVWQVCPARKAAGVKRAEALQRLSTGKLRVPLRGLRVFSESHENSDVDQHRYCCCSFCTSSSKATRAQEKWRQSLLWHLWSLLRLRRFTRAEKFLERAAIGQKSELWMNGFCLGWGKAFLLHYC